MRNIFFDKTAFEDLHHWANTDTKILRRVIDMIDDIQRSPFAGLGKPEPLKHQLKGYWSRRINEEHRLVYTVDEKNIYIASCRYHYSR